MQTISVKQENKVQAFFQFEVKKADTHEVVRTTPVIPNLVLDSGLNLWGTRSVNCCAVGTGTTTPQVTQTALINKIAVTATNYGVAAGASGSAPYYLYFRRIFRFTPGQATGNLTEAGLYFDSSDNLAFNRVLITDLNGNPTALTVLADEYLDVTVEMRVYQDLTDKNTNINLGDNITRAVLSRASNITSNSVSGLIPYTVALFAFAQGNSGLLIYNGGTIGSLTSAPSGSAFLSYNSSGVSSFTNPYVNNSLKRTGYFILDLNVANNININSMALHTSIGQYQFQFDPPITKTSDQTLRLDVEVSWGRYVS